MFEEDGANAMGFFEKHKDEIQDIIHANENFWSDELKYDQLKESREPLCVS